MLEKLTVNEGINSPRRIPIDGLMVLGIVLLVVESAVDKSERG